MAVPKRRTSKARRDKRRAHWNLAAPAISICSNCLETKHPHHVCPHCGYYKGAKVIDVAEA